MTAEDLQFVDILNKKLVKLTLKTTSYLGIVQRINYNKTLVLTDVVDVSNGRKFPGVKIFFGHEILNVEFPGDANKYDGEIAENKREGHLTVEEFQPYRKRVCFDDDDDDDDKHEYVNFEVIDEFHHNFGSAVMHIKRQHVIGVAADGVEAFQHGRLCWLQVATKNRVYLFDILLLGARAFKNGLSMILENKHILKVIHDCRGIAGCLMAQFGVNLTNVFDTQVADVMYFHSETGGFLPDRVSTLQEIVSLHLKVPSSRLSCLQMKTQLTKEEREMWYKRPCPVSVLKVMALSVIHLQPLRLVLLDALMTDYMRLVDAYLSSGHLEPDQMEHISMSSVLELPKELKQLDSMRLERQRCALEYYPVTEQGFLERFSIRPQQQASRSGQQNQGLSAEVESPGPYAESPPVAAHVASHQPSTPQVTDVSSVRSSRQTPPAPAAIPSFGSELRKQPSLNNPMSLGNDPGIKHMMGRGFPLGKEPQSSFPPILSMGRGFMLQIASAHLPKEPMETPEKIEIVPENMTSAPFQEAMDQPGPNVNILLGDITSPGGYQMPQSLSQSFRSFRET